MKEKKKLLSEQERGEQIYDITDRLDEMPYKDLVKIGHHLNRWEWIDILPGRPDGWEEMTQDEQYEWARPICDYIEMKVGMKALLRYFHTTELGKTNEEFEDWWDSSRHSSSRLEEIWQQRCHSRNYERNDSRNLQESIVPFLLGASVGVLLGTLLINILKICGVL